MNFFSGITTKIRQFSLHNGRNFSSSQIFWDKVPSTPPAGSTTSSTSPDPHTAKNVHQPDNLERRFLVWSGKYKRIEDVPKFVSYEVIERARNKARIKIANYMMAATAIACVVMAISGKRAAERGESVQKMNLDWHKEMKEQYEKEQQQLQQQQSK